MTRRAGPTRFVGIDSEGADVAGRHRLISVAAADAWGDSIQLARSEGIGTLEVLGFLASVRERWPRSRLVIFAGRYDVTQWLADAPRKVLAQLWASGEARWYRHGAASGPGRVSLHLVDGRSFGVWLPGMRARVTVSDVWGLFQSSFVDACEAWGEPVTAEIAWGKAHRAAFAASDAERAAGYSVAECAALARIMGRVSLAARNAGIRPSSWSGAGALAGALLRDQGMRDRIRKPARPEVEQACLTAYYGGRVDMLQQGRAASCTALDIRSAYPSALSFAPSMVGRWRRVDGDAWDRHAGAFGVWRARFASPPLRTLTPLPVRQIGRVLWPARGEGWWHACELRAAIGVGASVDVLEGFVFSPARGEPGEPWAWVRAFYAERRRLAAAGEPGEQVVKLALNSLYGKLAQNVGRSPYQCFALAGYVTAATRARMLRAADAFAARVVGIHTDGLLLAGDGVNVQDLDAPVSGELGAWSVTRGRNMLIVQPGVYTYDDPAEGARMVGRRLASRQRGVPADSLSWERIEQAWDEQGVAGRVTVRHRMHHGIGTCAGRRRWGTLGQWVDESREVAFSATTRFPSFTDAELQPMLPVSDGGTAIPYEPMPPDLDELLRREQPYPNG